MTDDIRPWDVTEGVQAAGLAKVRAAVAAARGANQARRARVLRHPDLAKLLCEPPLSYKQPEQWNGFVPPAECQEEIPEVLHDTSGFPNSKHLMTGVRERNNSPQRAALVAICAEALRRETEGGGTA